MSENEKRRSMPKLSRIHCGSKSPTSQPNAKEMRIAGKEELLRLAKGRKTLSVRKTELNVQNKKRNVTMRLYKSNAESSFLTAKYKDTCEKTDTQS